MQTMHCGPNCLLLLHVSMWIGCIHWLLQFYFSARPNPIYINHKTHTHTHTGVRLLTCLCVVVGVAPLQSQCCHLCSLSISLPTCCPPRPPSNTMKPITTTKDSSLLTRLLQGSCYRPCSDPIYFTHKSYMLLCIGALLSPTFSTFSSDMCVHTTVCMDTCTHGWDINKQGALPDIYSNCRNSETISQKWVQYQVPHEVNLPVLSADQSTY